MNYAIDAGLYPLGSCTMKHNPRLNEKMARLPGFGDVHPLQPQQTVQGALALISELMNWLTTLTGMPAVAMSPKAGAHGELCGLLTIRAALQARGEHRPRILVPSSAHGTNPATAALAGFTVDEVPAKDDGHVDADALEAKLGPDVAAIMLTNPNTCGLFEKRVKEIADEVHKAGAYFYCDGANFNAIAGRVRPGDLGIDAMHINLHKTFSTPHGGGGPGAGPVVLSAALAPYAPLPLLVHDSGGFRFVEHRGRGAVRHEAVRPHVRLPRPDGHVRARARLHAEPRRGRRAPGVGRCGAVGELHSGLAQGRDERAVRRAVHARGVVRRQLPRRHRRHHARFRQGDDRRGLSSDDDVFPAGRPRRHADRAHGIGIEGKPRPLHPCAARDGAGSEGRKARTLRRRAASSRRAGGSTKPLPPANPCCAGSRRTT